MQVLSPNTLGGAVEDAAGAAVEKGTEKGPRKSISKMYQKMTQHEHVLKRPDTYIGSVEPITQPMWVYDRERDKMVYRCALLSLPPSAPRVSCCEWLNSHQPHTRALPGPGR